MSVCVVCCWDGSKSWTPYERVGSCPQQHCSAPVDSRLRLFFFLNRFSSPLTWPSSFPAAFYFLSALLSFPKNSAFSWCAQSRTASGLLFLADVISGSPKKPERKQLPVSNPVFPLPRREIPAQYVGTAFSMVRLHDPTSSCFFMAPLHQNKEGSWKIMYQLWKNHVSI